MTEAHIAAMENYAQQRAEQAQKQTRFTFEGETFTVVVGVTPQVAIDFQNMERSIIVYAVAAQAAAEAGTVPPKPEFTDADAVALADATALACLDKSSHAAWKRLRSNEHVPAMTFDSIFWMCRSLIAMASEFPTERPVESSTGPQTTNGSSKAKSSSKEAARKG
jgi:hypothetical protein